jgi:PEGA domain
MTREGFGIELRRGSFDVSVDGQSVGSLDYGQTLEASLEPGQHTLRVKLGRYSSRHRSFEVSDGQVVSFRCHAPMVWPRWVASFVRPDLGISVRRA